jgi:hypothetical protein
MDTNCMSHCMYMHIDMYLPGGCSSRPRKDFS